ncbi:nucleoside hydrolase [Hesseltinella vesiculosa]|uniref:Nucleoside hydrolase n=1 Tax=Hesseltinella vesiculosa TaxID=101127 RepID=A0A1X2GPP7_9FUNG|nr:nucleoside hydrolase [Hesseltinella vesiculosa]
MVFIKEPVIIDTDPGIDDALAIIFAFLTPEIDVKALTLTHGNVGLDAVTKNAVTLLHAVHEQRKHLGEPSSTLPVLAIGQSKPLSIDLVDATYFHGKDGFGEIYDELHPAPDNWEAFLDSENSDLKETTWFTASPRDAADEILHQLAHAPPLTVTICAIGPLTNIALAIQRDPVTASRAKRIVIMGGAVHVPGNTTPYGEFNFRADPHAADIVMQTTQGFQHSTQGYERRLALLKENKQAPQHVVLVPLDGSNDGTISKADYDNYIVPLGKSTPLHGFINAFMRWSFHICAAHYNLDNWAVFDAYAMFVLLEMIKDKGDGKNNEDFDKHWKYEYLDMAVETEGRYTLGQCCIDRRSWRKNQVPWHQQANAVQVITDGDGKRFRKALLATIFNAKFVNE